LLNAGAKVYLSDLQEFAWAGPSDWSFGKAGRIGNPARPNAIIRVHGEPSAKALCMHPPPTGYSRVCYFLQRRAQSLAARVCFSEHDQRIKPNPTRFVVL